MTTLLLAASAALALGAAGCGEDRECASLGQALVSKIKQDCPASAPQCYGNPKLDNPVVPYSEAHYKLVFDLQQHDCSMPNLGQAPVFCHEGSPQCPPGYLCCRDGTSRVCRRACADGG